MELVYGSGLRRPEEGGGKWRHTTAEPKRLNVSRCDRPVDVTRTRTFTPVRCGHTPKTMPSRKRAGDADRTPRHVQCKRLCTHTRAKQTSQYSRRDARTIENTLIAPVKDDPQALKNRGDACRTGPVTACGTVPASRGTWGRPATTSDDRGD